MSSLVPIPRRRVFVPGWSYGLISVAHDEVEDWGLITDAVTESEDWGTITEASGPVGGLPSVPRVAT